MIVICYLDKRGVGKTSAVFSAINKVLENRNDKKGKILPVVVNAPSFDVRKLITNKEQDNNGTPTALETNESTHTSTTEKIDFLQFKRGVCSRNLVPTSMDLW